MKILAFSLALLFAATGCSKQETRAASKAASQENSSASPVRGPFSSQELQQFVALNPLDTHTHVYGGTPAFYAMLKKLNLHILDITLADDTIPVFKDLPKEIQQAWQVVDGSDGHVALCTSFDSYKFSQPGFSQDAGHEPIERQRVVCRFHNGHVADQRSSQQNRSGTLIEGGGHQCGQACLFLPNHANLGRVYIGSRSQIIERSQNIPYSLSDHTFTEH
jgi:hypothetical protein